MMCHAVGLILTLIQSSVQLTDGDILLIVNDRSATSSAVASLYLAYHPLVRVCHLTSPNIPSTEIITRAQYETTIRDPIMQHLTQQDLWSTIDIILTTKGCPLKVSELDTSDGDYSSGPGAIDRASIDSELCLLPYDRDHGTHALPGRISNPFYRQSCLFDSATFGMFCVGRIDGYDTTDISNALARAQNPTGISLAWTVLDDHPGKAYDSMPQAYTLLKNLGQSVVPDPWQETSQTITTSPGQVQGYCSHGAISGMPATYIIDGTLQFTYANGAVFTTYESFNAVSFNWGMRSGQGLVADFLRAGGTAGLGHTSEPWTDAVAKEDILFPWLDLGHSFIEAAYASLRYLSWQNVAVGEPLMVYPRPHPTALPTRPPTSTPTGGPTASPTPIPTSTSTPTRTPTVTPTEEPASPTSTDTATPTHTPTASPTMTVTGSPTATPTATPWCVSLWDEDFEDHDDWRAGTGHGAWTQHPGAKCVEGTYGGRSGTQGRIQGVADAQNSVSSLGMTNVTVQFWSMAAGLDAGEQWFFEVSYDSGINWTIVDQGPDAGWTQRGPHALGAQADNHAGLKIRFRTDANNPTQEYQAIDDILVIGCTMSLSTATPTMTPTHSPTSTSTALPTFTASSAPTHSPTSMPTGLPTSLPTPTSAPTWTPTSTPTVVVPPVITDIARDKHV